MLDMMLYFSDEFIKVHSFVKNSFWNHDVEDNAYTIMESKKGIIGMLHSTATEWRHKFRLEITLEKAQLELSGILSGSKSYGEEKLIVTKKKNSRDNKIPKEKVRRYLTDKSWKREIDEFASCIINNKVIENGNSNDALNVMKLIQKIYKSDSTWKKSSSYEKYQNYFQSVKFTK